MAFLLLLIAFFAAAADPASFEVRKARVRSLIDQEQFVLAAEQAEALNKEWPDDIATYRLMAEACLGLGRYAEAEQALQWMLDLRIGKADASGWLVLSRFREVTGDIDGALEAVNMSYTRIAASEETLRSVLLANAARLHYIAARFDLAERAVAEALKAEPGNAAASETLARVRLAQGRPAEAVGILRGIANSHARVQYLLATTTGAAADLAAFERLASADSAGRERILYLAERGRRKTEALALARKRAAVRQDVSTLDALAVALFANGKTSEARATMQKTLAVGTRDPEILAHARRMGLKAP